MSWPLASFLLVAIVLAVGWIAYERRRPSARMAAVVAVMAALAALGRDAFAALPDVKPITAMTLVVGYALGPIPGFTVGALGMLASNFMLGQGPYTPWQMAAWGMVGLLGAALGRLSRRRLGRVGLALACAAVALSAKEMMNIYTWTLGASHTPAAFLAVAGQALAYDVTDVVASFLFGLAFALELARVLARMRVRMDITWAPTPASEETRERVLPSLGIVSSLLGLAIATMLLGGAGNAPGAAADGAAAGLTGQRARAAGATGAIARSSLAREVAFLTAAQNADGGFGGSRGQSSSELYSGWVAMGLAAAGRDPLALRRGGHTVLDALRGEASSLQGAGDLERTILALRACGVSVHSLPGGDPVRRLLRFQSPDGSFGHLGNLTAFAIFALRAAGYPAGDLRVRSAARWLAAQQNRDGGYGFAARGGTSDVDDTAAIVQGLLDAGVSRGGSSVARAEGMLVASQNLDGGFPQQPGGESNGQSTAWAIQGLIAAGRDVRAVRRAGSRSPAQYLLGLLAPDGSVRYSRTGSQTPVWVTAQALTALAGRSLPIAPVRRHAVLAGAPPTARLPIRAGGGAPARGVATGGHRTRGVASGVPATGAGGVSSRVAAQPAARRLDGLAHAFGALLGAVLGPLIR